MAIGTIGKYERLDVLGHGTSGVVYLAWDTLLRRQVALKEIRAAAPEMERVLEEARVLDRLRHPNIVAIHGVDHENGAILIDMELVRGQNLADLLRERGRDPLPVAEAARIALAVLDALDHAHEQRVVHRDVKPANILVGKDGAVKLTDFGLAEALGTGSVIGGGGTYPYMAPEDFAEEEASDYRADLWAVGVVLYEMLAGRRPFAVARPKDPFAWKRAIEAEDPAPVTTLRPELPPALDAVLARALAKGKGDRFPSARAFATALRAAVGEAAAGATVGSPRQGASEPAPPPSATAPDSLSAFRFAGGAVLARTLDELLLAASEHEDEARRALLDGRMERWLRSIGEVYIADLAAELARREGEDPSALLREFLDRSGLDIAQQAARDRAAPGTFRTAFAGPLPGVRGATFAPAPEAAEIGTVVAPGMFAAGAGAGAAVAQREPPPAAATDPRAGDGVRWWFWPLLALCLLPPAGAVLFQAVRPEAGGVREALLSAWVVSGFLAALLWLVVLGANLPALSGAACFVLVAAGTVASGMLVSTRLDVANGATIQDFVATAVVAGVLLLVLLIASVTVTRLWRVWAFLILGGALLAGAVFARMFS